jgi:hypothetical protein
MTTLASRSSNTRPSPPTAKRADAVGATAGRSREAASADQVLVVFLKQMQHGRASDAYRVRALGTDRLALALFATRGLEMAELPKTVRRALALSA